MPVSEMVCRMVGVNTRCMPVMTRRARGAHDAHSQEAQLSLHEVDECGDALADHDADRADHDDCNGSSNEEDQHGLEEVLGDSGVILSMARSM